MKKPNDAPTDSTTFSITLRGEEKELFDSYMYTHIVNTGEIKISASTLTRRILVKFITERASELKTNPLTFEKMKAVKIKLGIK